MRKKSLVLASLFYIISAGILLGDKLPSPFTMPVTPHPGSVTSSCISCFSFSEKPYINKKGQFTERVVIGTSPFIDLGQLLKVELGDTIQYSPNNYLTFSSKAGKDGEVLFYAYQGGKTLIFKSKTDSFGNEPIHSIDSSSVLQKEAGKITVTNFRSQLKSTYESNGENPKWLLKTVQRMDFPNIVLTFEYSENGNLKSFTLPDGNIYNVAYQNNGLVSSLTDADGQSTNFEWSNKGQITKITTYIPPAHPLYPQKIDDYKLKQGENFILRAISCEYYEHGALASIVTTDGGKFSIRYGNKRIPKTGFSSKTAVLTMPDGSRIYRTEYTDPKRNERGIEYGAFIQKAGKSVKVIDKIDKKTLNDKETIFDNDDADVADNENDTSVKVKRNAFNQVISRTYADDTSVNYEYDKSGRLISKTDEMGQTTRYEFDAARHPSATFFPGGLSIHFKYNPQGLPSEFINKDASITKYEWDAKFRLVSMIKPGGVKIEWTYKGFLRLPFSKTISSPDNKFNYKLSYSYDPQSRLTHIIYPDATSESWKYNCCNIVEANDRANAVTKYAYDGMARKTLEISPNGERTSFAYDALGRLIKTTYPDGTFSLTSYDKVGNVASEKYQDGKSVQYSYDEKNRKIREVWNDGSYSEYKYDKRGRLLATSGTHEDNIEYDYDKKGRIVAEHDYGLPRAEIPRSTHYEFDLAGRQKKVTNYDGIVTEIFYSQVSPRPEYMISKGILTHYNYDVLGRVVSISKIPINEYSATKSDKDKNVLYKKYVTEKRTYDLFGNLFELRTGDNHLLLRYTYRPDGQLEYSLRPVSTTGAIKERNVVSYGTDGIVRETAYRKFLEGPAFAEKNWNEEYSIYQTASAVPISENNGNADDLGRMVWKSARKGWRTLWTEDEFGNRTEMKYNSSTGQLISLIQDKTESVTFGYDKYGRRNETCDVLGRVSKTIYGKNGEIDGIIMPDGSKVEREYDQFGRLTKRKGAVNYPIFFTYSSFGDVETYTDANGAQMKFEYSLEGKLSKRLWPDGSSVENKYDGLGRLILRIEAGRATRYEYDVMGRPVSIDIKQVHQDGSSETSITKFKYNSVGKPVEIGGTNGTTDLAYDQFGRLVSEKSETGSVESIYNSKGLLAEKICKINGQSQSFSTKYFYDQFDRIARIVSPAGEYNYEYDKKGRIGSLKGPGYLEIFNYDKGGRLISKILNGKTLCSYEYDSMNRRIGAEINSIKWEYKYDEFGQLVSATSSDRKNYNYNYDKIGNSLAFRGNAYAFNKLNQFVNPGFKYDVYGNMTATPDGWKYTWDTQNRLIRAEKGNKKLEFAYDFMSRRTGRKVFEAGKLTADEKFVFDGYNMTLKYDMLKGMSSLTHFAWNGQELLSMTDSSGKALSYIKDGNKNVLQLVSKDGVVTAQYAYSPFGEPTSAPAKDDDNPYRFSSEQWDEALNMAYYNYRYYSPSWGRWLSRDPKLEGSGVNLYSYVRNTPTNLWDRLGMDYTDPFFAQDATYTFQSNGSTINGTWLSYDSGNGIYEEARIASEIRNSDNVRLFYGAMVTTSQYVPREDLPSLLDAYGNPAIYYGYFASSSSIGMIKASCTKSTDTEFRCPTLVVSVKISGWAEIAQEGATAIDPTYTPEYIRQHEFGHADYIWGEFVMRLFYFVNAFNHSTPGSVNNYNPVIGTLGLDTNTSCDDLRNTLNSNTSAYSTIKASNRQHDKWSYYGRGTISSSM